MKVGDRVKLLSNPDQHGTIERDLPHVLIVKWDGEATRGYFGKRIAQRELELLHQKPEDGS
jgi:hypothetical protein